MRIEIARNECRRASRQGDTLEAASLYIAAIRLARQCRSPLKIVLRDEAKREAYRIIDRLLRDGSNRERSDAGRLKAELNTL